LVTTIMAFWSNRGTMDCCGQKVFTGALPIAMAVLFFFLIVAEIILLIRAILLTLWPSVYEKSRIEAHGDDQEQESEDAETKNEIHPSRTYSESNPSDEDSGSNSPDRKATQSSGQSKPIMKDRYPKRYSGKRRLQSKQENVSGSGQSETGSGWVRDHSGWHQVNRKPLNDDFKDNRKPKQSKKKCHSNSTTKKSNSDVVKGCCCGFLKWNSVIVLKILNLMTLANPFFGCVIAFIFLYTSDKTESFVVLGIESLSIVLHFVSVRMEGGLRTWQSRCLHSIVLVPFLVTIVLVLLFLREGGVCYTVETEMFGFSGCEICPDTLEPPIDGMCGNSTLAGSGIIDFKNLKSIAERGAQQGSFCSADTNFCFLEF